MNNERLLVTGYIHNISAPKDLIELCLLFFYDPDEKTQYKLQWNVENTKRKLKDLPKFTMKHCHFGFFLTSPPNNNIAYIMLKLMKYPSNIKQITIYYEIKLNEDDKYRNINIASFHFTNINTAFKTILNKNSNKKSIKNYTKLLQFTPSSSFSIKIFTKILRIEYINHDFTDFYSNPHIFAKMKCKWKVSEENMDKIIICNKFNDNCWCLIYDESCESEPKYELCLLCLPNGISRINVKLTYNVTINKRKNRRKQRLHSFNQHSRHTFSFQYNRFKWISQSKILNLSLQICQIIDMNHEIIEECNWMEYGVNNNRKWANINL